MNAILQQDTKPADLVEFLHGCCGSPSKSTFIKAIKNKHLITWPGLTEGLVKKHLGPCLATAKGHIHQERQNLQSTKVNHNMKKQLIEQKEKQEQDRIQHNNSEDKTCDFFPAPESPNIRTNMVMYMLVEKIRKGERT